MGPEFIVIIGVLVGGGLIRWLEHLLNKPKKQLEPATDVFGDIEAPSDWACEALPTRVFEQRLVDAGIMEAADMTVCDSPACKDCLPTHEAIRAREQRLQQEATKRTLKSLSSNKKKANEITLPGGNRIAWPANVPEHAHWEIRRQDYGRGSTLNYDVMFTWIGDKGQTMYVKMVVPDFTHMSGEIRTGSVTVIATTKAHRESLEARGYKGTMPPRPLTSEQRRKAIEHIRNEERKSRKAMSAERRAAAIKGLTGKG